MPACTQNQALDETNPPQNGPLENLAPSTGMNTAAQPEQVVSVCVGGSMYSTTLGTLTAVPGSYLAILFGSGHWKPSSVLPGSDTPFIDRDGELFRYVLAYLRLLHNCEHEQQPLLLPDNPFQLQQLKTEADFYGLPGLALACSLGPCRTQPGAAWARVVALQQQVPQLTATQPGLHTPAIVPLQELQHRSGVRQLAPVLQQQNPHRQHPGVMPQASQVSTADVELTLPEQQHYRDRPCLANAVLQAQQVLADQQQRWLQDETLHKYADIILRHLLQLPLLAQQPDLVAALAHVNTGHVLEFRFAYFPVGDTRIDIHCRAVPPNTDQATAIAAAAAAAGAGAAASTTPSPGLSPRDGRQGQQSSSDAAAAAADSTTWTTSSSGRSYSGSLPPEAAGVAAVAAAAAAAAAVSSYASTAVMPGPGWGRVITYHRYTIKETPDKFVLTVQHPGEQQEVQEVPHAAFRPELKLLSSLHKLCVQQCPRASVAGLMWLLEETGFSSVQLSTSLETYRVGRNTFTGFTSIITCGL